MNDTPEILIQEIGRRNEASFRRLYDLLGTKVFQYLDRMVQDRQLAEQLLIETFAEVWRVARTYDRLSSASTWVIGIARHLALEELGRNRRKEALGTTECTRPSEPARDTSPRKAGSVLAEALKRMPPVHGEVLDLIFLQEMPYAGPSLVLGVPVDTVKSRVFDAKEELKGLIGAMGGNADDLL